MTIREVYRRNLGGGYKTRVASAILAAKRLRKEA